MNRLHFPSALAILVAVASAAFAKGSPGPPGISITGSTSFGSVMPHQTASLTLTITTSGNLTAVSVTAGGPFSILASSCGGGVKACTATVAFAPVLGGDYTTLFTATVDNYYRVNVTLSGHGYGPSYAWVTPVYLYGVPTATAGQVQLVLNSTGDTPLAVGRFSLQAGGPLTLGKSTCRFHPIALGTSCTLDIRYNFDEVDPGAWIDAVVTAATNSGTSGYAALYIEVGGTSN
jgi:hypothetical protein